MSHWGANTCEIDRALSLARYQGDAAQIATLEEQLRRARAACAHALNPEGREACVWCGTPLRPGLSKVAAPAAPLPRLARRGA
jgi:hypothetical protein